MNSQKTGAVIAAVLMLAVGGASAIGTGASTGSLMQTEQEPIQTTQSPVADADVDTTLTNGTVTITLTDETDGQGVANATVTLERTYEHANGTELEAGEIHLGTTDETGSISAELNTRSDSLTTKEFEIELEKSGFNADIEYTVQNDALRLTSEEYEYEYEQQENEYEEEEHEQEEENEYEEEEHEQEEENEYEEEEHEERN